VAEFVRFVFSVGGALMLLLAGAVWLIRRPTSRAAPGFILAVVILYTAASMLPITSIAARALAARYRPFTASDISPGTTAVVVLGSVSFTAHDWKENRFSIVDPTGADRVIEAVRVIQLINPQWVISSGGSVVPDIWNVPSGETMREELVELGVPADRILVETESRTTHEEAVIVARMLKPLNPTNVVIVTTDIHMRRSIGAFRAMGLQPIAAPARRPERHPPWDIVFIPSDTALDDSAAIVHELVGISWYWLRGWYRR